jgi:hypothetical protein
MPRLPVDLSKEIDARLTEIAQKEGISKAEAMRKAFALLSVAVEETAKGNSLGIVREDPENHKTEVLGRIVSL